MFLCSGYIYLFVYLVVCLFIYLFICLFTVYLFIYLFILYIFQLTDVLLYTTPVGGNQYKLNKMLPLLGMQVCLPCTVPFTIKCQIFLVGFTFLLTFFAEHPVADLQLLAQ